MLAVFAGIVSILSVAACLRFDVAIALPEKNGDAIALLVLALVIALVLSSTLLLMTVVFPKSIAEFFNQPAMEKFLWLIPLSVLFAGCYSALQMWLVREQQFPVVAKSRIAQSTAAAGVQITSGLFSLGPSGLLFGHTMNTGAACIVLGYATLKHKKIRSEIAATTWITTKKLFKFYDRFPNIFDLRSTQQRRIDTIAITANCSHSRPKRSGLYNDGKLYHASTHSANWLSGWTSLSISSRR